eukprot:1499389-Pleurochrysis_carterae.AAC.9
MAQVLNAGRKGHLVIVDEFNLVHRRQHVLLVPKAIFILRISHEPYGIGMRLFRIDAEVPGRQSETHAKGRQPTCPILTES